MDIDQMHESAHFFGESVRAAKRLGCKSGEFFDMPGLFTQKGLTLRPIIFAMRDWGMEFGQLCLLGFCMVFPVHEHSPAKSEPQTTKDRICHYFSWRH